MSDQSLETEHPLVRRAKILKLRSSKLSDAFVALNFELTKKLLLDVELDLSEVEQQETDDLTDEQYSLIAAIMLASKELVDSVNRAISFAGMATKVGETSVEVSAEDVKLRYKPFSFDGEIRHWLEFWDRFQVQIHSRTRLSKITKFTFLLECLKGKAAEVIKGLAVTEANYDAAIAKLKERYDNPERLVSSYYDELGEIEFTENASEQRSNYDSIQKILKNLESLKVETSQDILRKTIMSKFSRDTLRGALREVKRKEDHSYTVDDLIFAVDATLRIEEDIDLAHKDVVPKKKSSGKATTGCFVGGTSSSFSKVKKGVQSDIGPIRNSRKRKECVYCESKDHNSHDCPRFCTLAKRKVVLMKKGLCFTCLKDHVKSSCMVAEPKCSGCSKTGHVLHLCIQHMVSINEKAKQQRENKVKTATANGSGTFLQTFVCNVSSSKVANTSLEIRGILDPGSKKSYISERICRLLRLKAVDSNSLVCYRFGSSEPYEIDTNDFNITLINRNESERTYTFTSSPCISGAFRTCPSASSVKSCLPQSYNYADPDVFVDNQRPLDILIGGNLYNEFVDITKVRKLENGLLLLNSFFGWVPSGNISEYTEGTPVLLAGSSLESSMPGNFVSDSDFADLTDLSKFWTLETIGIKPSEVDNENDKVLDQFRKTAFLKDNKYTVCFPWKHTEPELPSNFRVAKARLTSMVQHSKLELLDACDKVFKEYLDLGIIEKAPLNSPYKKHYLPHRGIYQKNKIRVVFDGSSKTKTTFSINELIHKGPNLQENIVKLLLNFRLHAVGITADIEKAFLQVGLNEVDRDSVRFLWVKDITKPAERDNIIHLRFARVPFGINSSPYLLNIVINEHLSSSPANEWHLLAKERFYVDNLVVSVSDTGSAINLFQSLIAKFNGISMNLRDWASNDPDFIGSLPEKLIEKKEGLISILGIMWDREYDNFFVKLNTDCPTVPTKRNVLKFLASIFDPLGYFSPSTLQLKVFLQDCWKSKYDWSDRLPSHLEAEMNKIRSDLVLIPSIPVPRRVWKFDGTGEISLHVFCDASKVAYACCAYLVYLNPVTCESASTLIMSKVRTAPIKPLSMPRLELLGVLIGKRLAIFIRDALSVSLQEIIIWTDATTVLQWLNSSSVLPQFVHNRVSEIKKEPGLQIRYISGKQNPADIASRGESVSALRNNKLWWNGPNWITCKAIWPSVPLNSEIFKTSGSDDTATLLGGSSDSHFLSERIEKKFSSWEKRVRIFELAIRFSYKLLKKVREDDSYAFDDTEFRSKAEEALVKEMQRKYFGKEYRVALRAKLEYLDRGLPVPEILRVKSDLDLFMGNDLLLHCGGRLQNSCLSWDTIHPILLPRSSEITRSYIRYLHLKNHHIGLTHLLSKIREKYWITKGRVLIKSILHRCVTCRRWTGGSYRLPDMPSLPRQRVRVEAAFVNVGIDYMGPVNIKTENGKTKVYIAIFACLVTRAIHLEIARDTTAIEFLRALMRFVSIRGRPKFIITDNAGNFAFIQPLVGEKVNITNGNIQNYCGSNDIRWKFIPQYSPWQGGAYERLIGLVKNCLRKGYSQILLDYVDLLTALYNIADIINSRPLTFVSSDEVISALTPNHFIRLRPEESNVSVEVRNIRSTLSGRKLRDLWCQILGVVENFWCAFESQYLTYLREKHTRSHTSPRGSVSLVPQVNDIALVKESGTPRASWKLGRILSLDNRKAVAQIRCNGSNLTRSINHLFPLELLPEETSEPNLEPTSEST